MPFHVQHFFDPRTSTLSYVIFDETSRIGVVIDPVLDFDPANGRTCTRTLDAICRFIDGRRLEIPYVLDTHAHADHMTGLPCFKQRYGARSVIGDKIVVVQALFAELYHLGPDFVPDGRQFDVLLGDGDSLDAGPFRIQAHHAPGHTPACSVWHIGEMVFVGDVLFTPDYGTARCDFPGGSAGELYDSIQRLYELPGETTVFTCHDYQPGGRELRFRSTVAEHLDGNVQLDRETSREAFIAFRIARDAALELPTSMLAVLQINIRAGELPPPENNGTSYLKLPLDRF